MSVIKSTTGDLASRSAHDDQSKISECSDPADLLPISKRVDWSVKATWGDIIAYPERDCHVLRVFSNGKVTNLHRSRGVVVSFDSFKLNHEAVETISSIVSGSCRKENPLASSCFSEPLLVGKERSLAPSKSDCPGTLSIAYYAGDKAHLETRDLLCAADEPSNTVGKELYRALDRSIPDLYKI